MNNKMKLLWPVAGGTLAALLIIGLYSFSGNEETKTISEAKAPVVLRDSYRIYSLPVPDSLSFCGEPVPLNEEDVRERLDRELLVNSYWHSNTLLCIKRAARWFPVIEPILKEEGIPDDFKYISLIESGYTQTVSPKGAVGFWQFIDETGKKYGLEINDEVDERYHVEKSTRAACAYFREAYKLFGSWTTAAASYNMGIGGMQKQVDRQRTGDYWDLLLNEETSRYVSRVLALREVMDNAETYGFDVSPSDLYEPIECRTITIDSAVSDFAAFALDQGINYKLLKLQNPWLRQPYLTNTRHKTYEIRIPLKTEQ